MPLKAILIRVGIDQTFGQWNAPCNPETNDFVYVPIPQIETPNLAKPEPKKNKEVLHGVRKNYKIMGC